MKALALLLGVLTMTSYQPKPEQTKPTCIDRFHCTTSIDDGITKFGVAVSQDMLASGTLHYGDVLYIPGYGYRVVNDTMNIRHKRCIDLMVFTRGEEKAVGVRRLNVYKIEVNH